MPKKFNQAIEDVIAALDREKVPPKEITRRLNEDEAGLGFKVDIAQRSVYDIRERARKEAAREDVDLDATAHSIASVKKLALDRIAREIRYYEDVPPGKLTGGHATALRRLFSTLDDMERRERVAQKRRPAGNNGSGTASTDPEEAESTVERMARIQRESEKPSGA
jgi:hypothetical protein